MSRKNLHQFYVIKVPANTQLPNRITYEANIHFSTYFSSKYYTKINYLLIILRIILY